MYWDGHGVAKDDVQAEHWFRKAAERGHAKAQFMMGACYEYEIGVSMDWAKMVQWYQKGVDQGYPDAEFGLGGCYEFGFGLEKNQDKAVELYRKAAAHKHPRAILIRHEQKHNAPRRTRTRPAGGGANRS
jgi:TPR repeat protein